ncbi:hypothetical protein HHL28_15860 [Aerophototrophica crusticola]|uniref:Uncharacterized protein n=1 Tax=Aerophototrophica crusticola TaxID=1709002 RepID=A0A858RB04_9PROT|nr:hypothetical protein HHL28_15860 [Rhodospirillaceae bacterium B3]
MVVSKVERLFRNRIRKVVDQITDEDRPKGFFKRFLIENVADGAIADFIVDKLVEKVEADLETWKL